MSKTKQIKYHQELIFLIIAVLMLVILAISVFLTLGFLISRLNIAFNPDVLQQPSVVQFNIDDFKKLDLIGE